MNALPTLLAKRTRQALLRAMVLALVAGLITAASFPPTGIWPGVVIGPALFLAALRGRQPPVPRAWIGLWFGTAFYGVVVLWSLRFGFLAWLLLTLGQAAFACLFAVVVGWLLDRSGPLAGLVIPAVVWGLVMEQLRGAVPLGGFPWAPLAAAWVNVPIVKLASVWGALGISIATVFLASIVVSALRREIRAAAWAAAALATIVALSWTTIPDAPGGPPIRIAVVQGNVPLPPVPASPGRTARVLRDHVELAQQIPSGSVDLVLLPEGVLDIPYQRPAPGEAAPDTVSDLAARTEALVLAGVVSNAGQGTFRNSVMAVVQSGTVVDVYDKRHPVPFGEYVPWRDVLGGFSALRAVPRDMVRGTTTSALSVGGFEIATPISFEIAFPDLVRELASGAELMFVATNTSSYGPRAATAAQELQLTQLRAAETALWTVQASPSGISAVIDAAGEVRQASKLYQRAVVLGTVRLRSGATLHTRVGDAPITLAIGFLLVWSFGKASRLGRRSV